MAVQNTRFVLQAVANNKLRHKILQEFMLVNDSATVAAEVPVLLDKDDLFDLELVNFRCFCSVDQCSILDISLMNCL